MKEPFAIMMGDDNSYVKLIEVEDKVFVHQSFSYDDWKNDRTKMTKHITVLLKRDGIYPRRFPITSYSSYCLNNVSYNPIEGEETILKYIKMAGIDLPEGQRVRYSTCYVESSEEEFKEQEAWGRKYYDDNGKKRGWLFY